MQLIFTLQRPKIDKTRGIGKYTVLSTDNTLGHLSVHQIVHALYAAVLQTLLM